MFQGIVYRPETKCGPGRIQWLISICVELMNYLTFLYWKCYHCFSNQPEGENNDSPHSAVFYLRRQEDARKELRARWVLLWWNAFHGDYSSDNRKGLHFVALFLFIYLLTLVPVSVIIEIACFLLCRTCEKNNSQVNAAHVMLYSNCSERQRHTT